MVKICLDTGVISLFFSNDRPADVEQLFNEIKGNKLEAYVLKEVLVEVFKHLCRLKGIEIASAHITSFIQTYPIRLIDLDLALIIKAGTLKCQNSEKLSYIDCMIVAYCLNEKITLHTTEKTIQHLPNETLQRLKLVKHRF